MKKSGSFIEVDLFPEEVDSLDRAEVVRFKGLLENVAEEYGCRLTAFEIDRGTVVFAFDSDQLMTDILKILQDDRTD